MHTIISVAGLLALVALAFGDHAASMVARAIIFAVLALAALLALDIMTHGAVSGML